MSLADRIDWAKVDGLVPAIVQDVASGAVRMLGYMSQEALEETERSGLVTFFSRSRNRLWRKGETSGNRLELVSIALDCDSDALLVLARPHGPTCHTGAASCFGEGAPGTGFIAELADTVRQRAGADLGASYTARLLADGIKRIAQKVGEEGVETALAAVAGDSAEVTAEAADLIYHLTVLLQASSASWPEVVDELKRRHAPASSDTASS